MLHPNVPFTIHNQVVERVMELVDIGNAHYNLKLAYPFVHYNISHKAASGECTAKLARIGFNPWLLPHNFESYLQDTIPHEVAHYFEYHLSKIETTNPHNPLWYQIMAVFGVEGPHDCHNYELRHVPTLHSVFLYRCSCKTWRIQTITHRKIVSGKDYTCNKCNTNVEYSSPLHVYPSDVEGKNKKQQIMDIYHMNRNLNVHEFIECCSARGLSASYSRKIWYKMRPKSAK